MLDDARTIPAGTTIQTDICIVGAGAAGITIAHELLRGRESVCLLESGDIEFDPENQRLYQGRNVGLPYFALDECQLRYLGGNTNGWGGWCRPFDPIDFQPRAWVEHSGWPFSGAALAPYYRRAHALCELAGDDYDPGKAVAEIGHRRARILPFDPGKLETSIYRFSPPTRFGQAYREELQAAPNIRCVLNANVLGIQTTDDVRAVTHVSVGCRSGNRFSVAAKLFVLAAGGIENARLLLLSNDVAPNGLGNQHDLVGRFFMEHPHTKRKLIAAAGRAIPSALYGLTFHHRGLCARVALPAELQEEEALLNYSANIHPVYLCHNSPAWLAFRKLMLSIDPARHSDPFIRFPPFGRKGLSPRELGRILARFDKVAVAALLQLWQPGAFVRGFVLESKTEQAPNPDSRVTLDARRDAFGLNCVKLDWRTLPIDRHTVLRSEEIIDDELRRLGLGSLAPLDRAEAERWGPTLEGGWHQIGTTRAHDDPKRGVVDANCRVHGMANLFIAGCSVFPTGGTAPPTLTVVALAARLSEHLRTVLALHDRGDWAPPAKAVRPVPLHEPAHPDPGA